MDEDPFLLQALQQAQPSQQLHERNHTKTVLILLVSTTGDGEPTDTMRHTWQKLYVTALHVRYRF
jgi:hypothetical protein